VDEGKGAIFGRSDEAKNVACVYQNGRTFRELMQFDEHPGFLSRRPPLRQASALDYTKLKRRSRACGSDRCSGDGICILKDVGAGRTADGIRAAARPLRCGEQIDGAYEMNGWHYIVECRWREQLANIRVSAAQAPLEALLVTSLSPVMLERPLVEGKSPDAIKPG
jgi:hypothetical protein